jgi:ribose/xylose/arabinose/galactoside ABC-type transport system permease subunit
MIVLTTLLDSRHNYWNDPRQSAINILRQTSFLGIIALGAAVVIISGGIDLSSGSMIAFSGSVCAVLLVLLAPNEMRNSLPVGWGVISTAIAGTLLAGFLIGSLHAWLITVVGLPPFVATLATLVGLRSFARALVDNVTTSVWRASKSQIDVADDTFRNFAKHLWIPATLFALLAVVTWIMLSRTVLGRHLYALGGNEQAARLSGIRTEKLKWFAYVFSAMLSSLAGMLYVADTSTANPQMLGQGYELNAIAAAVVGGCSLQGGVGTIPGTVLGVLFLRIVIDGVAKIIKSGADVYEGLIVGMVVVLAVAFAQLRGVARGGKRFFAGPLGVVAAVNLALIAGAAAALFSQKAKLAASQFGGVTALAVFGLLIGVRWLEGRRERRS